MAAIGRKFWPVVCVLLVVSGCDASQPGVEFEVRDSLGIEIVEFRAEGLETGWTVASEPDWIIGDSSVSPSGLALHRVVDALILDDGAVLVAERSTQELIRVDPSSGEITRWGGEGDGPGEFRGISKLFDLGRDRIAVYDSDRRRIVEYDEAGSLRDDLVVPPMGDRGDPPVVEIVGASLEESTVFLAHRTNLPPEPSEGPYRGRGAVLRTSKDGATDTITTVAGATTFRSAGVGAGAVLFGPTTVFTATDDGLWVGDTDREEVVLWSDPDAPDRIVRWSTEASRELTDERIEALWDEVAATVPESQRAMVDRMRQTLPVADRKPAFGSLLRGGEGTLWIGEAPAPEVTYFEHPPDEQEWLVVALEAATGIKVITPEGLRVLRVGSDYVVGVHVDERGVETVRGYALDRTEGAR